MKNDRIYLLHIRDAIRSINEYTKSGIAVFIKDKKTQDAVIRELEIIGEATKQLSERLKKNHSAIPWRKIAGLRDKVIHEYFGVNLEIIWGVVENNLPLLFQEIEIMLKKK